MNRIQVNKLVLSKWTAVTPRKKEKHFLVTQFVDDDSDPRHVILEAVHSKREYVIVWTELKDDAIWRQGWR
jgi:tryptophan-rich hypothetical protein